MAENLNREAVSRSDLSRSIPYWFLALVGLVYASGFLVVSTFVETYNLREAGAELWKSRYIHIGLLSLLLPVIANATIYGTVRLVRAREDRSHSAIRTWSSAGIYITVEMAFFMFVMFGRRVGPGERVTGFGTLGVMLIVAMAGPTLAGIVDRLPPKWGAEWQVPKKLLEAVATTVRLTTLAVVLIAFGYVLFDYRPVLWDMVVSRKLPLGSYFLFAFLFGWIPWRTSEVADKRIPATHLRTAWVLALCLMFPTYYLALMSFSYAVFPYIPAIRGGGDYTIAPIVVVHLKAAAPKGVMGDYADPGEELKTKPAVLLEETAAALFVASPEDAGGPCEWRAQSNRRPRILSVSRDAIATVEYVSPDAGYPDCAKLAQTHPAPPPLISPAPR